ncbi:MBL fold metallo-hydrolase [Thiohalobacter thiocyanaticus]|uniref:MBL fold metallo-hydrolase n=1 Tax=Thiohalobacter thiocyanaticus TaxID=585455 RepID=UPI000F636742|nr:hypothetical protein [Thiohalobacter thiocyanaticus]
MPMRTGSAPLVKVIGAESLGVRGLCTALDLPGSRIVIDPGVSLGYRRSGLLPHPVQVAIGRQVREQIVQALETATDVVISHFHGDHIPLADANPYQLSLRDLPAKFPALRCWSKSTEGLPGPFARRYKDLKALLGGNLQIAEGRTEGLLSFSDPVPHGAADSGMGSLMMTRVELPGGVFVHASDIQLLDDDTVQRILDWQPDIVLAAGPPLYLRRLDQAALETAWNNALRLARSIGCLILDHHLTRSRAGADWLKALSRAAGRQVWCAADYMQRPRQLLEAERARLYARFPVPAGWHQAYAEGRADPTPWLEDWLS